MSDNVKSAAELLKEKLLMEPKNIGLVMDEEQVCRADAFCSGYKSFLNEAKIEREAVRGIIARLKEKGFVPFDSKAAYKPGDRVYSDNRGKALIAAVIGSRPAEEGTRIVASHIDSPRLDMKPRPLYEEAQLGYFKTHYYGGIKKYQWAAIPLALHGVVVKKDGTAVEVNIGEDDGDPIFCVTDLLPHLAQEQMKRTLSEGIRGEELNILMGCMPYRDDKVPEKIKLNLARLLFEKYDLLEEDFLSAELSAVPAFKARDLGLDRGMIGGYGHDDRVCVYTSLAALLETGAPEYTAIAVFADKEETGSEGNTGLQSYFLRYFVEELAGSFGASAITTLSNSKCLSADVNCAYDPTFADVTERRNTAYINYGVVLTKYTGSRGKSGTNDASAEFMAEIRSCLDEAGVVWQTGELGKVDAGGGGTVAKYVSKLNVEVVDIGVPVLSMHAPMEVVSKCDVYSAYQAFKAFMK